MAASSAKRKTEESLSKILFQIATSVISLSIVGVLLGALYLLSVRPVEGIDEDKPTATAEDVSKKLAAALRGDFENSTETYEGILSALQKPLVFRYTPGGDAGSSSDRIAEFNDMIAERKGTVSLSDADLNRIAESVLRVRDSSTEVIQKMKEQGVSSYSVPTSLNFRIEGDTLQIASTLKVKNLLMEKEILFITRGTFRQRTGAASVTYHPEFVYFNSVRVPPPLDGILAGGLIQQFVRGIFTSAKGAKPKAPRQVSIESERLVIAL